jgi:hypothetical protein
LGHEGLSEKIVPLEKLHCASHQQLAAASASIGRHVRSRIQRTSGADMRRQSLVISLSSMAVSDVSFGQSRLLIS